MPNITCQINQTLRDRLEKVRQEYEQIGPRVGPRDDYTTSDIIRVVLNRGLTVIENEIEAKGRNLM